MLVMATSESRLYSPSIPVPLVLARSTDRMPITSATPEQVDVVYALRLLARSIPSLLPKVISGEAGSSDWSDLADVLYRAGRLCLDQVVVDAVVEGST